MDVVFKRPSVRKRLGQEAGTGAGTVILWVGGFCVASWIFFGVIDWIVAVRQERQALREEQAQSDAPQRPFTPKPPAGTQITF